MSRAVPPVPTALGLTRVVNRTPYLTADLVTLVDRVEADVPEAYRVGGVPVPAQVTDARTWRRTVLRSSLTYVFCLTREDPRVATDHWSQNVVGFQKDRETEDRARGRAPVVPPGTWLPWVDGPYRSYSGHETYFDIAAPWLLHANPLEALFASTASSPADVRLPFGAAQVLARRVQERYAAWAPVPRNYLEAERAPDPDLSGLVIRLDAARARWWRP